ncbi:MAG TPA: glycosyltransferase [Polyangiaceae bacterium]|nr:glycosyltransferase [Polyangiaceae bacterium]
MAARRPFVCFVIERLADRSGGAERIVVELANRLAASGRRVHLITYERGMDEPFYALARGVTHMNLRVPTSQRSHVRRVLDRVRDGLHAKGPHPKLMQKLLWHSKRGGFVRALERYLALHRPDVVVAVAPPTMVALANIRPQHAFRRVASLHNVPALDLESLVRWDRNPLDIEQRKQALQSFDAITVLQTAFRSWFDEPLRSKVHVIPNPVYSASSTPVEARERVVLYVGRLATPKRVDILIDAWAKLKDRFGDWRVEVFGTGILEPALQRKIRALGLEQVVQLRGHTRDIAAEYARAAILAHPAEYEGWGLSVSEALARGVPCVGFADCPGINALIVHEHNGLLVPPADNRVDNFASALARLMADDELRTRLGAAGPGSVAQFAPDAVQAMWEHVLDG